MKEGRGNGVGKGQEGEGAGRWEWGSIPQLRAYRGMNALDEMERGRPIKVRKIEVLGKNEGTFWTPQCLEQS